MTNRETRGIIVLVLIIIVIISQCVDPTNNTKVKKGSSYDKSYDKQVEDLREDLNKSDYDGIVIYDDDCNEVVEISK